MENQGKKKISDIKIKTWPVPLPLGEIKDNIIIGSIKDKYLLNKDNLDRIFFVGSNHLRRYKIFHENNYSERALTPAILNPWKLKHTSNTLNIVIGDSHVEFATRYYRSFFENNESPKNISLAMVTGATTLIGAIRSRFYFENLIRSLILINNQVRDKGIRVDKLNIIISLGEIDVRTKIYLESLKTSNSFKEVIDSHLDCLLSKKLIYLNSELKNIFKEYKTCLYFKIPPPPSTEDSFSTQKYEEAINIIKHTGFPRFGNINHRKNVYMYLVKKIDEICSNCSVEVLSNPGYFHNYILEKIYTHDGCHVSTGEWAKFNSRQIIWL